MDFAAGLKGKTSAPRENGPSPRDDGTVFHGGESGLYGKGSGLTGRGSRLLARAVFGALVLAFLNQWLFFDKPFGLSVPLFVTLLYVWYFAVAGKENRSGTPFAWVLLASIGLLSLTCVWFAGGVFHALNVLALFVLAAFHAVLHAGRAGGAWFRKEAAVNALFHLVPGTLRNIPLPFRLLRGGMEGSIGQQRLMVAAKIAFGLVIACPVVLVVTALLISADRAFEQVLFSLPDWWRNVNAAEWVARGIWMAVVFLFLSGFVWSLVARGKEDAGKEHGGFGDGVGAGTSAVSPRIEPARLSPDKTGAMRTLAVDPVIAHTVLVAVNAVYVVFVAVQFSYLFGAWDGVLPDGKTYAEYARSGFFELVAVSVINYGLLSAVLVWSRPSKKAQIRWQRGLLTALLACTLVMLVSSHVRLSLYEEAYGYTVLRFLVHAFLVYMGALLAAAFVRVWRDGVSLVRLFVLISLAAWLAVNYAGVDRQVAKLNIARYESGGKLDVHYLTRLSDDALPVLLPLADDHPEVRDHLERRLASLKNGERSFASFNLSHYRARKLLENGLR